MARPELILAYEPVAACESRLLAEGYSAAATAEIASYLAQSTDLAPEFDAIADACGRRGIRFVPVELDAARSVLAARNPGHCLVWTLTDGIAYFRGSAIPALARLGGHPVLGSDDAVFALCQDKFRSGAVLGALGMPVPNAGLCRDGAWIPAPPPAPLGYFVKPNRLGAKIGIWPDSRCQDLAEAEALSRRVFAAYRDDVVVQPYVPGRDVRASFLAVDPLADVERLGIFFVDSGGDFQTMADSLALYGDTGAAARASNTYAEPELIPVARSQPVADRRIREIASQLMRGLGLRDVFSMDFRVEADDTVHLIEFEVCPGLPCFDFRGYCLREWGLGLADAMAETAACRFAC
ncbi:D-alanine:D-lactate ligase-like protein [Arvimicrobium flavum]|uniref:D-alanine:D-lactate ligase-like protein n=1 Tax=Arvimicrobium flavum TaxID=3393320 RepID=UPI00237A7D20|nr:D-alanine:D-lactate ligase-like protein [Mesorhizobium shangrilense]